MASFVLCDVFAAAPFSGNPLAVFLDAAELSDDVMLAIARDFGWSEVTFVLEEDAQPPRVRIWTPQGELPFAGHPTVGTAVVLASERRIPTGWATLELGIGPVAVEVSEASATHGYAAMTQRTPAFGKMYSELDRLAGALRLDEGDLVTELPAQVVSTGAMHFIVPVRSLEALGRARMNLDLFEAISGGLGIRPRAYLFCTETPGSTAAARARLLGPGLEDAATGSAAGPLGAYLVRNGLHRAGAMDIEQGIEMGHPSLIAVDVPLEAGEIGPVRVAGHVHIWARGKLELDKRQSPMLEI